MPTPYCLFRTQADAAQPSVESGNQNLCVQIKYCSIFAPKLLRRLFEPEPKFSCRFNTLNVNILALFVLHRTKFIRPIDYVPIDNKALA